MEEVKRNSLKAWLLAARPKTLTGAITPVLIGTALAAMDGRFHWLPALVCCLFATIFSTSSKEPTVKTGWAPNVLAHKDGSHRRQ